MSSGARPMLSGVRVDVAGAVSADIPPWRYAALAVLFSLLWASAFIAVKVALRDSPPLFMMASRFLVAGGLLLVLARLRRAAFPRDAAGWGPLILLGVLNYAIYLGLTAVALRHLSAGMGAVLASTNPLMLALVAPWFLGERLTLAKVAGLLLSFGGVLWVMASRLGDDNRPDAMVIALVAMACLVAGTVVFKRCRLDHDLLVINGIQLLAAGLALAGPSVLLESLAAVRLTPTFLVAQTYLIVAVSWVGMLIWFWLLSHGDATRASAYFFLNPILGLFLGAFFLGEALRFPDFAGSGAVAVGIYIVQRA
jgi:drug/metabolite transporter (DMT)-like permease